MEMKICNICEKELPSTLEYFYKKDSNKDGLMKQCKKCNNDKRNARYKSKKKPKILGDTKLCVGCDKYLPFDMFYKASNTKDGLRCYCKTCQRDIYTKYMDNEDVKEKVYSRNKKNLIRYEERNKEKRKIDMSVRSKKRLYLMKDLVSDLTIKEWRECLEFFDYKDAYTGLEMNVISQDHIIPVSKGGGYTKTNIIPCELSVNKNKLNNDMESWYRNQDFFSEERLNKIKEWSGWIA